MPLSGQNRPPPVVGYTTKDTTQGKFYVLGAGFEGVTGSMDINDLLTGFEGTDYDEDGNFVNTASQVQIPDGAGFIAYYFLNNAWDAANNKEVKGWADALGDVAHIDITPGVAFWAKSVKADSSLTVSGAVPEENSSTVSCPVGFAIRANIFPVSTKLNTKGISSEDIVGVDYDESGNFTQTASQIQVYDGTGFIPYYYLNNAWDAANNKEVAGWADALGDYAADVDINVGEGFWTKGVSGAFTLKFQK